MKYSLKLRSEYIVGTAVATLNAIAGVGKNKDAAMLRGRERD